MVKKTVLKVDVSCDKCKQEVFSIVSSLEGVDKMEADAEKDLLTVIGDADPFAMIKCLRKAGKKAQFVSVGPKEEKKPDPPKCPCCLKPIPPKCPCCCKPDPPKCCCTKPNPPQCCCPKPDTPKCQCPKPAPPKCQCSKPDPPKCTPSPCPKPDPPKCSPCPYPCPRPGNCWVCEPIAVMTMNYQDPAPPVCSIM